MDSRHKLRFVTFLTFARFPLVLLFCAAAVAYTQIREPWIFTLGFTFLVLSAVTDFFDGYLARKFEVETRLGAHADPLMDKFYYLSTLPLLVFVSTRVGHTGHALILLVLTLLFLSRDQWVTFLRSIGSIYGAEGKAHWTGKLRTAINLPLICAIYFYLESPIPLINLKLLYFFEALALAVNMLSLYVYTRLYWSYLRKAASMQS